MKRPTPSVALLILATITLWCTNALVASPGDSLIPGQAVIRVTTAVPIDACGTLVEGADCVLFAPAGDEDSLFALDYYADFQVGDTVCVFGMLVMQCESECSDAEGCIVDNAIESWQDPGHPTEFCGILIQGSSCTLFVPLGQEHSPFVLDNYGGFQTGDTVLVTGSILFDCEPPCPEAVGCIADNTIDTCRGDSPGIPIDAGGILVQGPGCLLFSPFDPIPFVPGMGPFDLNDYGGFQAGDSVFIFGFFVPDCQPQCPAAAGCIDVVLIQSFTGDNPSNHIEVTGVLLPGSSCILFVALGQPFSFVLENYGGFQIFDTVLVDGFVQPHCDSMCPEAFACIVDNTIEQPWPNYRGIPLNGCGLLVQGTDCVLFSPFDTVQFGNGPALFTLDNYGDFQVGDSVFLFGFLSLECQGQCPEAGGCVEVHIIEVCNSQGAGFPFEGPGVLLQGADCVLFSPGGPGFEAFVLDQYGAFQVGDSVFVTGTLDPGCYTECSDADGCIIANTIEFFGGWGPSFPFDACGVLKQGMSCLLFAPGGDEHLLFILEDYGGFQVDDTVCVSGVLNMACQSICTDAFGCIEDNSITAGELPAFPFDSFMNDIGGSMPDTIYASETYLMTFPDTLPVDEVVADLERTPGVLLAQPNYVLELPEVNQISQAFPDQKQPGYERGSFPAAYYGQHAISQTKADYAKLLSTGRDVKIAIIDNGLDLDHPLLLDNIESVGRDFVDMDDVPEEETGDQYGHGTFVAGLICLVAPDSRILPVRAFDGDGRGSSFGVSQSIYWAVEQGADIINMSFSQKASNQLLEEAVAYARQAGAVLVASVGNDSTSGSRYPAAYEGVIAVSSIDSLDYFPTFSSYGEHVDVCAPGVDLYSSLAGTYNWGTWSGTSFSAALVSGVCALVTERKPELATSEMENHIGLSARTQLQWGMIDPPDVRYGSGCLDAFNAVLAWSRGDVDNTVNIDLGDLTILISYLFLDGAPPQVSMLTGDIDCNSFVDIGDLTMLIDYLFMTMKRPDPCY